MKMPQELISVIIPFYNAESYIASCVESLKKQTYPHFEALFVDDGSMDGSVEVLQKYWDDRFVLLKQNKAGVSAARNLGLRNARGTFIAFMDVDDGLENTFLQTLVESAVEHDAQIVLCDYVEVYENGKCDEIRLPWENRLLSKEETEQRLIPLMISAEKGEPGPIRGSSVRTFVRRAFWEKTGVFFDTRVIVAEDLLFVIALYNRAERIYIASDCLYMYRKNASSATNCYHPDGLEKNLEFHSIFVNLLKAENLYEQNLYRYNANKICMYTAELSNQARNPKLTNSLGNVRRLREELIKEPFDWRQYPVSKGRALSLWMLEHKLDMLLLVLYRLKEWIRLRNFMK